MCMSMCIYGVTASGIVVSWRRLFYRTFDILTLQLLPPVPMVRECQKWRNSSQDSVYHFKSYSLPRIREHFASPSISSVYGWLVCINDITYRYGQIINAIVISSNIIIIVNVIISRHKNMPRYLPGIRQDSGRITQSRVPIILKPFSPYTRVNPPHAEDHPSLKTTRCSRTTPTATEARVIPATFPLISTCTLQWKTL